MTRRKLDLINANMKFKSWCNGERADQLFVAGDTQNINSLLGIRVGCLMKDMREVMVREQWPHKDLNTNKEWHVKFLCTLPIFCPTKYKTLKSYVSMALKINQLM